MNDQVRPEWCCVSCEASAYLFAAGHGADDWLPPKNRRSTVLAALLRDVGAVRVGDGGTQGSWGYQRDTYWRIPILEKTK